MTKIGNELPNPVIENAVDEIAHFMETGYFFKDDARNLLKQVDDAAYQRGYDAGVKSCEATASVRDEVTNKQPSTERPSDGILSPDDPCAIYYDLICKNDTWTVLNELGRALRVLVDKQPTNMFPSTEKFEAAKLLPMLQQMMMDFKEWRKGAYKLLAGVKDNG